MGRFGINSALLPFKSLMSLIDMAVKLELFAVEGNKRSRQLFSKALLEGEKLEGGIEGVNVACWA